MKDMIKRNVKDSQGRRIGVLIGVLNANNEVEIGWSRCRKGDVFNADYGETIAWQNRNKPIPPSFAKAAEDFRVNCFRYFKRAKRIMPARVMNYTRQCPGLKPKKTIRNNGHKPECNFHQNGICSCCLIAEKHLSESVASDLF